MAEVTHNVSVVEGLGADDRFIDPTNYASSGTVVKRATDEVLGLFKIARADRTKMNEKWARYYDIWKGEHTIRYYSGEADLRIRMGRKITDTRVAQTKTRLFPDNPIYFVEPADAMAQERVPSIRALIDHDIEQAKLRTKMDLFLTTLYIYGFAVFKNYWKVKKSTNYRRRAVGDEGQTALAAEEVVLYEGPAIDVVDPLRFYIYPIEARSLDEAQIVFEDIEVPFTFLKDMEREGIYHNVDRVKQQPPRPSENGGQTHTTDAERQRRNMDDGFVPGDNRDFRTKKGMFRLTEAYAMFRLYGDEERLIPCKITAVGPWILEIRQNPFAHQEMPYRMARMTDLIDNVYGQGLIALIEDYQYAVDAMVNQGIDSANFHINHIVLINDDVIDRDQIEIKPRAVWSARGVNRLQDAAKVIRPPDTSATAFATAAQIIGLMEDIGGAPPVLQGKIGPGEDTATEISAIAAGASVFVDSIASKIEAQALSPTLRDIYMLEQQFRSPSAHAKITGDLPFDVSWQDLVGDYAFQWHVSSGAMGQLQVQQFEGGMTATPQGPPGLPPGGTGDLLAGLAGGV